MSEAPFPHFCRFLNFPSARLNGHVCAVTEQSQSTDDQTHLDDGTLSGLGFLLALLPLGEEHVDAFSCFPCTLTHTLMSTHTEGSAQKELSPGMGIASAPAEHIYRTFKLH